MRRSSPRCKVTSRLMRVLVLPACWILIAGSVQALSIDFGVSDSTGIGSSPNDVQSGYEAFNSSGFVSSNSFADSTYGGPITRTFGGVGVTVSDEYGGRVEFYDLVKDVPDYPGELIEDGLRSTSGILLTLTGLAAGNYEMTLYTHIASNNENTKAGRVYQIANGSYTLVAPWVTFSYGYEQFPSMTTFSFSSTGAPVELLLDGRDEIGDFSHPVYLNGFDLYGGPVVPEPASGALLGLGLAGIGLAHWRRRR